MFKKYQAVFTSRWKALWWAAGVCLTAYCTVPSQEQSEARHAKHHAKHANPWAIDRKS
jgi:hypothetical protein